MWTPVLPFLWLHRLGREVPDDWRLPGDDFVILRGAYQQNFELSCQALPMLVVAENAARARCATTIQSDSAKASWVPAGFPRGTRPPRTLSQFRRLNAEAREAYLDKFPITEAAWREAFDRGIRNTIAHADVDEVVSTGDITTGKGAVVSYANFVESIVKQLLLLLLWLNLARMFRVYYILSNNG